MRLVEKNITNTELKEISENIFGDFVKAVVDIKKELIAVDSELHSDIEAFLLENGSLQENLWGINLYHSMEDGIFIEFDSMINVRPRQGNRSRGVDSPEIRKRITDIVNKWVK